LINAAQAAGVNAGTLAILNNLVAANGSYPIGKTSVDIDAFLAANIPFVPDRATLKGLLMTNRYLNKNFVGPNFFIGSSEIFGKHWKDVFISLNWKGKPTNFRDYYEGYISEKTGGGNQVFGLDEEKFEVNLSMLEKGQWLPEKSHPAVPVPPYDEETTVLNDFTGTYNRRLFPKKFTPSFCASANVFQQTIHLRSDFFPILNKFKTNFDGPKKYEVTTKDGFLRITLQNQDFLHADYAYVLARQMNAAAMLRILDKDGKPTKVEGAIYYDANNKALVVFNSNVIKDQIKDAFNLSELIRRDVNDPNFIAPLANAAGNNNPIPAGDANTIRNVVNPGGFDMSNDVDRLKAKITEAKNAIDDGNGYQAVIPKEPWTPIISQISIDYTATATIDDIQLTHLYPYHSTYKQETLKQLPSLFPTFCDEGTLFLGLSDLVPGDNLNILFQLAEATADSEENAEDVFWYYLDANTWKPLRSGFEVLDDATENLTSTGIIKFSLPANISNDNTVMPKGLHWLKAGIPKNSKATSETIDILTQAALAVFTNEEANDKLRLSKSLPAGSVAKLDVADASIKAVAQPFGSFNGAIPESESLFYVRVSETLRHKGRAIQSFDYERIVLQAFPKVFKAKSINHSFALNAHQYDNDFPYAPGYVSLAVIPDLNQLQAGNSYQPMVPVSMLEQINEFVRKRTSPFVRFRAVNPRYETINFCLRLQLRKGKDKNYYKEKTKQDIRELLAPWAVGKYDKLTFGQCIYRADVVQLLEASDYVDFITDLSMYKAGAQPQDNVAKVCPSSPRSILVAGDIAVCIEDQVCEEWSDNYTGCDGKPIRQCDSTPIPVMDYCGQSIIKKLS
jgi:hypothetical protein